MRALYRPINHNHGHIPTSYYLQSLAKRTKIAFYHLVHVVICVLNFEHSQPHYLKGDQ